MMILYINIVSVILFDLTDLLQTHNGLTTDSNQGRQK